MIRNLIQYKHKQSYRAIAVLTALIFFFSTLTSPFLRATQANATVLPYMPEPGRIVELSSQFQPVNLKGLRIYTNDPFKFDFIINEGDAKVNEAEFQIEASRLIKYFLASLTIPKEDLWVNLSPYEGERIAPYELGMTDLGKDLLGEDYLLKQLTASMTYPESPVGKKFWDKIYAKAYELYGTTNIPVNTFNKVWIVPDKIVVYEDKDNAIISEAKLKVMMEEDYLAASQQKLQNSNDKLQNNVGAGLASAQNDSFAAEIMREVVVPHIEKEVNEGQQFSLLRQIYHSFILATWYKLRLKESIMASIYVDKKKIKGVEVSDEEIKAKIYNQYLEAFEKGTFNYLKRERDTHTKKKFQRQYYSGGVKLAMPETKFVSSLQDTRRPGVTLPKKDQNTVTRNVTWETNHATGVRTVNVREEKEEYTSDVIQVNSRKGIFGRGSKGQRSSGGILKTLAFVGAAVFVGLFPGAKKSTAAEAVQADRARPTKEIVLEQNFPEIKRGAYLSLDGQLYNLGKYRIALDSDGGNADQFYQIGLYYLTKASRLSINRASSAVAEKNDYLNKAKQAFNRALSKKENLSYSLEQVNEDLALADSALAGENIYYAFATESESETDTSELDTPLTSDYQEQEPGSTDLNTRITEMQDRLREILKNPDILIGQKTDLLLQACNLYKEAEQSNTEIFGLYNDIMNLMPDNNFALTSVYNNPFAEIKVDEQALAIIQSLIRLKKGLNTLAEKGPFLEWEDTQFALKDFRAAIEQNPELYDLIDSYGDIPYEISNELDIDKMEREGLIKTGMADPADSKDGTPTKSNALAGLFLVGGVGSRTRRKEDEEDTQTSVSINHSQVQAAVDNMLSEISREGDEEAINRVKIKLSQEADQIKEHLKSGEIFTNKELQAQVASRLIILNELIKAFTEYTNEDLSYLTYGMTISTIVEVPQAIESEDDQVDFLSVKEDSPKLKLIKQVLQERAQEASQALDLGWKVGKLDLAKLGWTNDALGKEATDWLAQTTKDIIAQVAFVYGAAVEIPGRDSDEFTFYFAPGTTNEEIDLLMAEIVNRLKETFSQYSSLIVEVDLDDAQVKQVLADAGAEFIYSHENAKIVFQNSNQEQLVSKLNELGHNTQNIRALRVPYSVMGVLPFVIDKETTINTTDAIQEMGKEMEPKQADLVVHSTPEMHNAFKKRSEGEHDVPMVGKTKTQAINALNKSSQRLRNKKDKYADKVEIYGTYQRSELHNILSDLGQSKESREKDSFYEIRGRPENMFVVETDDQGNRQIVKFSFTYPLHYTQTIEERNQLVQQSEAKTIELEKELNALEELINKGFNEEDLDYITVEGNIKKIKQELNGINQKIQAIDKNLQSLASLAVAFAKPQRAFDRDFAKGGGFKGPNTAFGHGHVSYKEGTKEIVDITGGNLVIGSIAVVINLVFNHPDYKAKPLEEKIDLIDSILNRFFNYEHGGFGVGVRAAVVHEQDIVKHGLDTTGKIIQRLDDLIEDRDWKKEEKVSLTANRNIIKRASDYKSKELADHLKEIKNHKMKRADQDLAKEDAKNTQKAEAVSARAREITKDLDLFIDIQVASYNLNAPADSIELLKYISEQEEALVNEKEQDKRLIKKLALVQLRRKALEKLTTIQDETLGVVEDTFGVTIIEPDAVIKVRPEAGVLEEARELWSDKANQEIERLLVKAGVEENSITGKVLNTFQFTIDKEAGEGFSQINQIEAEVNELKEKLFNTFDEAKTKELSKLKQEKDGQLSAAIRKNHPIILKLEREIYRAVGIKDKRNDPDAEEKLKNYVCIELNIDQKNNTHHRIVVAKANKLKFFHIDRLLRGQKVTDESELNIDLIFNKQLDTLILTRAAMGGEVIRTTSKSESLGDVTIAVSPADSLERREVLTNVFSKIADRIEAQYFSKKIIYLQGNDIEDRIKKIINKKFNAKAIAGVDLGDISAAYNYKDEVEDSELGDGPFVNYKEEQWKFIDELRQYGQHFAPYLEGENKANFSFIKNYSELVALRKKALEELQQVEVENLSKDEALALKELNLIYYKPDIYGLVANIMILGTIDSSKENEIRVPQTSVEQKVSNILKKKGIIDNKQSFVGISESLEKIQKLIEANYVNPEKNEQYERFAGDLDLLAREGDVEKEVWEGLKSNFGGRSEAAQILYDDVFSVATISSTGEGDEIAANIAIKDTVTGLQKEVAQEFEVDAYGNFILEHDLRLDVDVDMDKDGVSGDLNQLENTHVVVIEGKKVILVDAPYLSKTADGIQYASAGIRRGTIYVTRDEFGRWLEQGITRERVLHEVDEVAFLRQTAIDWAIKRGIISEKEIYNYRHNLMNPDEAFKFNKEKLFKAYDLVSKFSKDINSQNIAKKLFAQAHNYAQKREDARLAGKGYQEISYIEESPVETSEPEIIVDQNGSLKLNDSLVTVAGGLYGDENRANATIEVGILDAAVAQGKLTKVQRKRLDGVVTIADLLFEELKPFTQPLTSAEDVRGKGLDRIQALETAIAEYGRFLNSSFTESDFDSNYFDSLADRLTVVLGRGHNFLDENDSAEEEIKKSLEKLIDQGFKLREELKNKASKFVEEKVAPQAKRGEFILSEITKAKRYTRPQSRDFYAEKNAQIEAIAQDAFGLSFYQPGDKEDSRIRSLFRTFLTYSLFTLDKKLDLLKQAGFTKENLAPFWIRIAQEGTRPEVLRIAKELAEARKELKEAFRAFKAEANDITHERFSIALVAAKKVDKMAGGFHSDKAMQAVNSWGFGLEITKAVLFAPYFTPSPKPEPEVIEPVEETVAKEDEIKASQEAIDNLSSAVEVYQQSFDALYLLSEEADVDTEISAEAEKLFNQHQQNEAQLDKALAEAEKLSDGVFAPFVKQAIVEAQNAKTQIEEAINTLTKDVVVEEDIIGEAEAEQETAGIEKDIIITQDDIDQFLNEEPEAFVLLPAVVNTSFRQAHRNLLKSLKHLVIVAKHYSKDETDISVLSSAWQSAVNQLQILINIGSSANDVNSQVQAIAIHLKVADYLARIKNAVESEKQKRLEAAKEAEALFKAVEQAFEMDKEIEAGKAEEEDTKQYEVLSANRNFIKGLKFFHQANRFKAQAHRRKSNFSAKAKPKSFFGRIKHAWQGLLAKIDIDEKNYLAEHAYYSAESYFKKAIRRNQNLSLGYIYLARVYEGRDDYRRAAIAYNRAADRSTTQSKKYRAKALYDQGLRFYNHNSQKALPLFVQAVRLNPDTMADVAGALPEKWIYKIKTEAEKSQEQEKPQAKKRSVAKVIGLSALAIGAGIVALVAIPVLLGKKALDMISGRKKTLKTVEPVKKFVNRAMQGHVNSKQWNRIAGTLEGIINMIGEDNPEVFDQVKADLINLLGEVLENVASKAQAHANSLTIETEAEFSNAILVASRFKAVILPPLFDTYEELGIYGLMVSVVTNSFETKNDYQDFWVKFIAQDQAQEDFRKKVADIRQRVFAAKYQIKQAKDTISDQLQIDNELHQSSLDKALEIMLINNNGYSIHGTGGKGKVVLNKDNSGLMNEVIDALSERFFTYGSDNFTTDAIKAAAKLKAQINNKEDISFVPRMMGEIGDIPRRVDEMSSPQKDRFIFIVEPEENSSDEEKRAYTYLIETMKTRGHFGMYDDGSIYVILIRKDSATFKQHQDKAVDMETLNQEQRTNVSRLIYRQAKASSHEFSAMNMPHEANLIIEKIVSFQVEPAELLRFEQLIEETKGKISEIVSKIRSNIALSGDKDELFKLTHLSQERIFEIIKALENETKDDLVDTKELYRSDYAGQSDEADIPATTLRGVSTAKSPERTKQPGLSPAGALNALKKGGVDLAETEGMAQFKGERLELDKEQLISGIDLEHFEGFSFNILHISGKQKLAQIIRR